MYTVQQGGCRIWLWNKGDSWRTFFSLCMFPPAMDANFQRPVVCK